MPFNFKQYEQRCAHMSKYELRLEIEKQSDTIATAGAGTGFALLAIPLTLGISAVALGGTAPAIINATKKRTIAKKYVDAAPDNGPNVSLRPSASRARPQRPAVVRRKTPDDELPAYVEVDEEARMKAREMYGAEANTEADAEAVSEAELEMEVEAEMGDNHEMLPTYDEATIRRLTLMGIPPSFLRKGQAIPELEALQESIRGSGSNDTASSTAGAPNSNLHRTLSRSSSNYSDNDPGHYTSSSRDSPSTSTPDSPRTPRTPSPDHAHKSICLLGDEIPHQLNKKGKSPATNPFLSHDEKDGYASRF